MNNEMDIAEMYGQDGDIGPNPRISVLERDLAIAQGVVDSHAECIKVLDGELAAAQAECESWKETVALQRKAAVETYDAHQKELAALRVDAERYRWLRDRNAREDACTQCGYDALELRTGELLDAAIDQARGAA